jgi:hypothetical protein
VADLPAECLRATTVHSYIMLKKQEKVILDKGYFLLRPADPLNGYILCV